MQYLHGTAAYDAQLRDWTLEDRLRLRATVLAHATQTDEPARCAALLPLLAGIAEPLALIEVGAAAGLCLYPDRYSYDNHATRVGPSQVPSSNGSSPSAALFTEADLLLLTALLVLLISDSLDSAVPAVRHERDVP
ncbi:DUF2332 family protein [Blastococcus sp. SYSU DS0619]